MANEFSADSFPSESAPHSAPPLPKIGVFDPSAGSVGVCPGPFIDPTKGNKRSEPAILLVLFRFDMRIAHYWAGILSGFGELLSLFDLGPRSTRCILRPYACFFCIDRPAALKET